MIKDLLESKKCFKLVCGAGHEDAFEVERLVYLYAKAGCRFFDLNASPEIVLAAKRAQRALKIHVFALVSALKAIRT